jgi:integrase
VPANPDFQPPSIPPSRSAAQPIAEPLLKGRRQARHGSISERGARWLAQQPPSQGRKSKTFDDWDKAQAWLDRAHATAVLYGADVDQAGVTPLGAALSLWIDGLAIKESTRAAYRQQLRPILAHSLATMPVRDVRHVHVDTLMLAAPSGNPRDKVGDRLRPFFRWATAGDLIARDPWVRSQGEKLQERALDDAATYPTTGLAWTVDEARRMIADIERPYLRTLVAFMLVTGARRGEAIGLPWNAIDGHAATISRNRTVAGGGIVIESRPKTRKSRLAYFGPHLAAMLDGIRPPAVKSDDYVFVTDRTGEALSPGGVAITIKRQVARIGLPNVGATHALRRTFATALDNDGCPEIVREKLLGHSGSRYAVPHEADLRKWAERADELFLDGIV